MAKELSVMELIETLRGRGFKIKDRKELNEIIKGKGIQIQKDNERISAEIIDQILKALHHHPLKSHEISQIKQRRRDRNYGELLSLVNTEEISKLIAQWWRDYFEGKSQETNSLGVVCISGFLRGENEQTNEPAVAYCCHGLDIFIGDRGSGKSTFLRMFALLSDCLRENTQSKDSLEWLDEENIDEEIQWKRKIANFLSDYDVEKYACYFYHEQHLWVFYAQITDQTRNTGIYTLLRRNNIQNKWIPIQDLEDIEIEKIDGSQFFPNMKVFNQGEIIRIANEGEDKVLNRILVQDALYSELKKTQERLRRIGKQFFTFNIKSETNSLITLDQSIFQVFVTNNRKKIESLREQAEQNRVEEIIKEVNGMIYGNYKRSDQFLGDKKAEFSKILGDDSFERTVFQLFRLSNLSTTNLENYLLDDNSLQGLSKLSQEDKKKALDDLLEDRKKTYINLFVFAGY